MAYWYRAHSGIVLCVLDLNPSSQLCGLGRPRTASKLFPAPILLLYLVSSDTTVTVRTLLRQYPGTSALLPSLPQVAVTRHATVLCWVHTAQACAGCGVCHATWLLLEHSLNPTARVPTPTPPSSGRGTSTHLAKVRRFTGTHRSHRWEGSEQWTREPDPRIPRPIPVQNALGPSSTSIAVSLLISCRSVYMDSITFLDSTMFWLH